MRPELLPWQHQAWSAFAARRDANRVPHALLLSGPEGLGKSHFAGLMAQSLLCRTPDEQGLACGECRSCLLYGAGSHPDLIRIAPEAAGKPIKVDMIRRLRELAAVTSQYGHYRVVIIAPAEAMNSAAANSLLKILEEPPADTVLLLVSSRPAQLLPTVRSRCQRLAFRPPAPEQTRAWLAERVPADAPAPELLIGLAHGAPLRALALVEEGEWAARTAVLDGLEALARGKADPLACAAQWIKPDVATPLNWLYVWVSDLIRLRTGTPDAVLNQDRLAALQAQAERMDLQDLFSLLDAVGDALRLAPTQVNAQLMLEGLLLEWTRAMTRT